MDRCGKSTHSSRLVESLRTRGLPAEIWRFQDRTTQMRGMIDSYNLRESLRRPSPARVAGSAGASGAAPLHAA